MKFFSMALRACRQGPSKPTFKGRFFKVNSAAFELGRETGVGRQVSVCVFERAPPGEVHDFWWPKPLGCREGPSVSCDVSVHLRPP